ncbi:hypothetical protein O181_075849, partial [Austropuccinia psidii MF-1]|nr:hypothetical protein [Austropuccinia psidii MF-1]
WASPFGLIGLCQKGPDWPKGCRGHLGPGPPNEKGWLWLGGPEPPRRQKDTPGPKTKTETWGLEIWKLAREANDGRIWPKGHGTPKGFNWP